MDVLRILPLQRGECEARLVIEANILPDDAGQQRVTRFVVHVIGQRGRHIQNSRLGLFEDTVQTAQHNEG